MAKEQIQWGRLEIVHIPVPLNAIIPCWKCHGIMRKKWNEGMVCDCNPPISGWDWCCENCGHTEVGGMECGGDYYIPVYIEDFNKLVDIADYHPLGSKTTVGGYIRKKGGLENMTRQPQEEKLIWMPYPETEPKNTWKYLAKVDYYEYGKSIGEAIVTALYDNDEWYFFMVGKKTIKHLRVVAYANSKGFNE